ncbi:MAG: ester cyclase [Chloroflexota bacterium]
MAETTVRDRLRWMPSAETHRRIKRLWVRHSIAEDRRDIPGLISTLTPACVYELVPTGDRWDGHAGATAFYTGLLGAFPDIHFDLTDIVVGPQGVFEVADVTATHERAWVGFEPTGRRVKFRVLIHFPWDPDAELFGGERIYLDRAELRP